MAEVEKRYGIKVNVYKPEACTSVADFEKKWGQRFWERDEDTYDFAVKVSPLLLSNSTYGMDGLVGRSNPASALIRN